MNYHILLVDNDDIYSESLKDFWEYKHGDKIQTVGSLQEGINIVKREFFDLIIVDYDLKISTGVKLVSELQKYGVLSPIIIISSKTNLERAKKELESESIEISYFYEKSENDDTNLHNIAYNVIEENFSEITDRTELTSFVVELKNILFTTSFKEADLEKFIEINQERMDRLNLTKVWVMGLTKTIERESVGV